MGGERDAKARLAAKGFQGPDLKAGLAEAWARVSLRSSRPHVAPTSALKEWKLRSLDIRDAPSQAASFDRAACPRVPLQWDQQGPRRVWRLRALVSELNSLREHDSLAIVGLRFEAPNFDPRSYSAFRAREDAEGSQFASNVSRGP